MHVRALLLALSLLTGLVACRSAPSAPAEHGYTLVLIHTGPHSGQLPKAENDAAFAGHFANMGRMAEARQLVVAGPFGAERHDPTLRGLFVLATAERAEAETWAGSDPTTQAGVFQLEFHELSTEAPLGRALEEALAWQAAQKAAGKTPEPADGARPYVLLTAEHADLAWREFAPLATTAGGVFLLAKLDGTRALAVLDAPDLAGARERFGPQLENLGAHELDEWFATNQLARLPELRAE